MRQPTDRHVQSSAFSESNGILLVVLFVVWPVDKQLFNGATQEIDGSHTAAPN